jgi:hypothetical protein
MVRLIIFLLSGLIAAAGWDKVSPQATSALAATDSMSAIILRVMMRLDQL